MALNRLAGTLAPYRCVCVGHTALCSTAVSVGHTVLCSTAVCVGHTVQCSTAVCVGHIHRRVPVSAARERLRRGVSGLLTWMGICYAYVLRTRAGRRYGDAAFHPILPWVTDLNSPPGHVRTFTLCTGRSCVGSVMCKTLYQLYFSVTCTVLVASHV